MPPAFQLCRHDATTFTLLLCHCHAPGEVCRCYAVMRQDFLPRLSERATPCRHAARATLFSLYIRCRCHATPCRCFMPCHAAKIIFALLLMPTRHCRFRQRRCSDYALFSRFFAASIDHAATPLMPLTIFHAIRCRRLAACCQRVCLARLMIWPPSLFTLAGKMAYAICCLAPLPPPAATPMPPWR